MDGRCVNDGGWFPIAPTALRYPSDGTSTMHKSVDGMFIACVHFATARNGISVYALRRATTSDPTHAGYIALVPAGDFTARSKALASIIESTVSGGMRATK